MASAAVYADSVASAVPAEYLQKYFTKIEGGYKVNSQIRKRIIFSVHDVLVDPPFSKLDLLVCRNLFIYLKPTVQQGLLQRFYYSLNPNGYLFMGNSESIGEMSDVFLSQSRKYKIYQKKEVPGSSALMGMRLSRDYGNFFVHNYRIREKNDERGLESRKLWSRPFHGHASLCHRNEGTILCIQARISAGCCRSARACLPRTFCQPASWAGYFRKRHTAQAKER